DTHFKNISIGGIACISSLKLLRITASPKLPTISISREYRIISSGNIINVVGGKLTTYRTIALKIAREVLKSLEKASGETRVVLKYRRDLAQYKADLAKKYDLDGNDQISFAYDSLYEMAVHADDILWRREGYFIFSRDSGLSHLDACLDTMKKVLGISDEEAETERRNYIKLLYR
ncbi:glycerol-3-phosphate dehydrogenase C-terminal domain-containing protein, partial [Thermoplasma sp.]|uniref:glycerol-3-phosphate dehydrogenase C-terminal domain-containing protein n=1 Tax=Thermoplasma sp. TaxID=1973142 RepID=UPI001288A88D